MKREADISSRRLLFASHKSVDVLCWREVLSLTRALSDDEEPTVVPVLCALLCVCVFQDVIEYAR